MVRRFMLLPAKRRTSSAASAVGPHLATEPARRALSSRTDATGLTEGYPVELTPTISLNIWTAHGITVEPLPAYDHVTVNLGDHVRVFSTDPDVVEGVARAVWGAADPRRAKAGGAA